MKMFSRILLSFSISALSDKYDYGHLPYTNTNVSIIFKTVKQIKFMIHSISVLLFVRFVITHYRQENDLLSLSRVLHIRWAQYSLSFLSWLWMSSLMKYKILSSTCPCYFKRFLILGLLYYRLQGKWLFADIEEELQVIFMSW